MRGVVEVRAIRRGRVRVRVERSIVRVFRGW